MPNTEGELQLVLVRIPYIILRKQKEFAAIDQHDPLDDQRAARELLSALRIFRSDLVGLLPLATRSVLLSDCTQHVDALHAATTSTFVDHARLLTAFLRQQAPPAPVSRGLDSPTATTDTVPPDNRRMIEHLHEQPRAIGDRVVELITSGHPLDMLAFKKINVQLQTSRDVTIHLLQVNEVSATESDILQVHQHNHDIHTCTPTDFLSCLETVDAYLQDFIPEEHIDPIA